MQMGKRLADIRKKNQYTQKELAQKLNVSQQIISNIERDLTAPDINFLQGAADLYNMTLDELIGRDFIGREKNSVEQKIMRILEKMDDTGKELSLGLLHQVAQHQGNNDDQ